jgi:uncharacterized LabA/DUF88 family protein
MPRTCVFVDGAYFQKVLEKDFNKARIDFERVGPVLSADFEPFLRTYYYNCKPYQSAVPSEMERRLFANAERFYYRLAQLSDFQLRLGRLEYRGVAKETGQPIFEQKRVDVQLAVDVLTLAYSRQVATAVVVAGDSDFIPAFQAAKDQGVRIVLCYGRRNPAHRDLVEVADKRIVLTNDFLAKVCIRER